MDSYIEYGRKEFPDFFFEKGSLAVTVTPLNLNHSTYWMSHLSKNEDIEVTSKYLKPYDDNDTGMLDCEDIDETYDITLEKSGKFTTSFYVPSSLLPFIIGAKASRLKNLERTTNNKIKVPKHNEKGDVKIIGDSERKVASARTQISMIVMQRKDKLPISHFISIPMVSDEVVSKFKLFKDIVMKDPPRGVTESLFQNTSKLHLTISTLTLIDDEEITAAKKVLTKCYDEYIGKIFIKNNYRIHLKGLEIMNDDPSLVNVLYGKVYMEDDEENNLQNLADSIADYFYKSSLSRKQYDSVKLHVTLMNTSFRGPEEKLETFDATSILKNFRSFDFGCVDFQEIHLSIRFTGKMEYYESALIVSLKK